MRFWTRKRRQEPTTTHSMRELDQFVGLMLHDLGNRVSRIRSIAYRLQCESNLQSAEDHAALDDLARAADELAKGFGMLRSVRTTAEPATCHFVVDVMEAAVSLASLSRHRPRLLVARSARNAPPVRLRRTPALLAVARLIDDHAPETVTCKASSQGLSLIFTLELSGHFAPSSHTLDAALNSLLGEAGVVSSRSNASEDGTRLVVALETEATQ